MSEKGEVMTFEELAALQFEPWVKDKDMEKMLSQDSFNSLAMHCRLAYALMLKTKAELVAGNRAMGGDEATNLLDSLQILADRAKAVKHIIEAAHIRLMSALAVMATEDDPTETPPAK